MLMIKKKKKFRRTYVHPLTAWLYDIFGPYIATKG